MTVKQTQISGRRNGPSLKYQTDVELLQAVACQRDADAFGELFRRYKGEAFNLAYYVSRNREVAEEAVQEGMLRVWSKAESFKVQETDKVKSWILCIVARRAQLAGRRRRREQEIVEKQHSKECSPTPHPLDAINRGELLDAMRQKLDLLPTEDRVMVGLYFGAGMSQLQISKNLSIPQTTVSFRINKILGQLKEKHTASGMATMWIHTEAEWIFQAICQRLPEPSGLNVSARSILESGSPPSVKPFTMSIPLWLSGSVLAVLAATYVIRPSPKSSIERNAEVSPIRSIEAAQARPHPFHKLWNFEKEHMKGFPALYGEWELWRPSSEARKGHPAGMVAGKNALCCVLPIPAPTRPIKITILAERDTSNGGNIQAAGSCYLDKFGRQLGSTFHVMPKHLRATSRRIEEYISGRYILRIINNKFSSIQQYEEPYPSARIGVVAQCVGISQIEVQSCALNDIPEEFRDPEAFYAAILKDSSWKRQHVNSQ